MARKDYLHYPRRICELKFPKSTGIKMKIWEHCQEISNLSIVVIPPQILLRGKGGKRELTSIPLNVPLPTPDQNGKSNYKHKLKNVHRNMFLLADSQQENRLQETIKRFTHSTNIQYCYTKNIQTNMWSKWQYEYTCLKPPPKPHRKASRKTVNVCKHSFWRKWSMNNVY